MAFFQDLLDQSEVYYDQLVQMLPKYLMAFIFSVILYFILKTIISRMMKIILKKSDDILLANFIHQIAKITSYIITFLFFLYAVGQVGVASSILGAATISSVVIGFAFKDIAENFLAGVIMAFNRPFRLGDTVKTGEVEGSIVEMSLRDTRIKTFDGKDVYVPNGQIIKNPLYNSTIDGFMRNSFTVGVDYDTDIEKTRAIILEQVKQIPGILLEEKPPRTHVKELNTNTMDIEVHYWINTFDKNFSGLEIKSKAQTAVIDALTAAQVAMPANIVELKGVEGFMKSK